MKRTTNTSANNLLSSSEKDVVIEMRHAMHREPELSNNEWKTQQRIRETLERFGLFDAKTFHKTGLYVDIHGLASGPQRSVAIRGDIDALPIQETRDDLSYQSRVPGHMHACGHDLHASIAMGTALAFHRMRESFSGKLRVFSSPPRRRSHSADDQWLSRACLAASTLLLGSTSKLICPRGCSAHAQAL